MLTISPFSCRGCLPPFMGSILCCILISRFARCRHNRLDAGCYAAPGAPQVTLIIPSLVPHRGCFDVFHFCLAPHTHTHTSVISGLYRRIPCLSPFWCVCVRACVRRSFSDLSIRLSFTSSFNDAATLHSVTLKLRDLDSTLGFSSYSSSPS